MVKPEAYPCLHETMAASEYKNSRLPLKVEGCLGDLLGGYRWLRGDKVLGKHLLSADYCCTLNIVGYEAQISLCGCHSLVLEPRLDNIF